MIYLNEVILRELHSVKNVSLFKKFSNFSANLCVLAFLTALFLLVAADNDTVVPPQEVRRLYSRLPVLKYMAIIVNSSHNFVSGQNQDDLAAAIGSFLRE